MAEKNFLTSFWVLAAPKSWLKYTTFSIQNTVNNIPPLKYILFINVFENSKLHKVYILCYHRFFYKNHSSLRIMNNQTICDLICQRKRLQSKKSCERWAKRRTMYLRQEFFFLSRIVISQQSSFCFRNESHYCAFFREQFRAEKRKM